MKMMKRIVKFLLRLVGWDGRNPYERVGLCRNCGEEPEAGNGLCPKCDVIRKDAEEDRRRDPRWK